MDAPVQLDIHVGDEARFPLKGPTGAGYAWAWSVEGDPGIIAISRSISAATPPPGPLPPANVGREETLVLEGLKPGEAVVHLSLRRSFEADKPPLLTRTLVVHVTP